MSRDQLVEAYLDGEISRRRFVRGLVATGLSLGTALTYAKMASARPGAPQAQGKKNHYPGDHYPHKPPKIPKPTKPSKPSKPSKPPRFPKP